MRSRVWVAGVVVVVVGAMVAAGAVLSACGGGSPKALEPTTTTPAEAVASNRTATLKDFCGRLSDLTTATAEIGVVTDLAQVRARFTKATALADAAVAGGTPPGSNTYLKLLAVDQDLRSVNGWLQSIANQAALNGNRQPADVRNHFNDLGVQFRYLEQWSGDHCQAFGAGGD